jgi:hypothetical protein
MSTTRRLLTLALVASGVALTSGRLRAQDAGAAFPIPDSETADPPTQARIQAIEAVAATDGWNAVVVPIRSAALRSYARERYGAADAWFHLYAWAALFSEPENVFTSNWVQAIVAGRANYEGVAGAYHPTDKPLGSYMTPGMQDWVLTNAAFSEEFFSNVKPVDYLPMVFQILEGLHRRNAERFAQYSSLALAIALVNDVAPPPYWPHGQVTPQALPRKLPNPAFVFDRLALEDMNGNTYHRLTRLRAEELKFVVDAAAPLPELDWSLNHVPYPLDRFEGAYLMIKYREDRAQNNQFVWAGEPYTLPAIQNVGGICVDQAYFASEAGKARGVPTLLFTGTGNDARHAWFGYLDENHSWQLDAGRYAELRLVTGSAIDPQTWSVISDHELRFLSDRFRALPTFMQSRVHEEFARDFLDLGDYAGAARAARSAVNYERRNLEAWETLIAADTKLGAPASGVEGVMREAALAFTPRYPDLVASFGNRVVQSLRDRGETSLASYEERGLADRMRGDRDDLAIKQAALILARSIATQGVPDQFATYNGILSQYGRGESTTFFDMIVVGFSEHLALLHMRPQAREAVERARMALDIQPGTPLAADVDKLLSRLQD